MTHWNVAVDVGQARCTCKLRGSGDPEAPDIEEDPSCPAHGGQHWAVPVVADGEEPF